MAILVVAETKDEKLSSVTKSAVTAAFKLGDDVDILIFGMHPSIEDAGSIEGVRGVITAQSSNISAEDAANFISIIAQNYTTFMAGVSDFANALMPRLSALLDVQMISEITDIIDKDTFVRPIYAGSALAHVKSLEEKKVITVRVSAFAQCTMSGMVQATVSMMPKVPQTGLSDRGWVGINIHEGPELSAAKVVVSGGVSLKNKENFDDFIGGLADKLKAAVGATRDAVLAGYIESDAQVGQSGKTINPDLYIAIGISGNAQHVAGIRGAKTIVAINNNPDAPIFAMADYELVGDLFEIVPKLKSLL